MCQLTLNKDEVRECEALLALRKLHTPTAHAWIDLTTWVMLATGGKQGNLTGSHEPVLGPCHA